ncbi:MAG: cysteine desulfurase [Succinivibrionaceae bacterium]|nr:cysteine desulfurase [Succinivibrionaceae bacterium]
MGAPIYLDYAAATPCDPRVVERMAECLGPGGAFGNPSSRDHAFGWAATEAVEEARAEVAEAVGADILGLTFTSGATEANCLALWGLAHSRLGRERRHLITSRIEHRSVLECCERLASEGFEVTYLTPTPEGVVEPGQVEAALRKDTLLVSICHGNSVLGSLSDIGAIARICAEQGVAFHTDAAQSAVHEDLGLGMGNVALATLTPEKICGPKGVGALYVRQDLRPLLEPLIVGGGQERGLRGGTVPTHQVAGMGRAFALMSMEREREDPRVRSLRGRLEQSLLALGGARVNGAGVRRLPGILSVTFSGIDGKSLLPRLAPDVACSTGSACSSKSREPSYVLRAIGLGDDLALSSLRLSMGRFTTAGEVDAAAAAISRVVQRLRLTGETP